MVILLVFLFILCNSMLLSLVWMVGWIILMILVIWVSRSSIGLDVVFMDMGIFL